MKMQPDLQIITAPNPILSQRATPIGSVDDSTRELMDGMLKLMYDDGVGLAANQVGILKRVLVINYQDDTDDRSSDFYPLFIANPEIIECSDKMVEGKEGCLSVPEIPVIVSRHDSIKISYLDYNNKKQELFAEGWLARIIQHEMDHLDGRLLIDYLSPLKKNVAMRRLVKIKKLYS